MLYAGLRIGESVTLRREEDIDFKQRKIYITPRAGWTTKGKRGRTIPMVDKLCSFLKRRCEEIPDSLYVVFPGAEVYDWKKVQNINTRIQKVFHNCAGNVGMDVSGDQKVHPHCCRHSYAAHKLMGGVPLNTLRELLGHQDIKTTMIYSHLSPQHIEEAARVCPY